MNTHLIVLMVQIVLLTIFWYLITVRRVPFTAVSGPSSTGLPDNELLLSNNGKITNSGMVIDDSKPASASVMWSSEKIMNTIKEMTWLQKAILHQLPAENYHAPLREGQSC